MSNKTYFEIVLTGLTLSAILYLLTAGGAEILELTSKLMRL